MATRETAPGAGGDIGGERVGGDHPRRRAMRITVQYFDGCPHWKLADRRLANVLQGLDGDKFTLEYQLIESPEMAERVGFRGSPTILIDGRDPFATGAEPIGMSCRVFRTENGVQGAPTEKQLREVLEGTHRD
jgi:glutaredoxin